MVLEAHIQNGEDAILKALSSLIHEGISAGYAFDPRPVQLGLPSMTSISTPGSE